MRPSGERPAQRATSMRRAHWLLLCGAATGVVLAAMGVLRGAPLGPSGSLRPETNGNLIQPLPDNAIARVNGHLIRVRGFEDALARETAGGMTPDAAAKRRLLEKMIDEELRTQRAIELNLHRTDARVRMDLSTAVAEAAIARAGQDAPDEKELRAYFEERRDYFAGRGPLRVRRIWVGIVAGNLGDAYNRARAAANLLREKEAFETVQELLGNRVPSFIPDTLLHPEDLAAYFGRDALDAALTLQPGEVADPIRTIDGFHVLQVLERRAKKDESFEGSRLDVEAEHWRARARRALEANAAELRKTANIQRKESL